MGKNKDNKGNIFITVVVNVVRVLLGLVFVFSGFVKAIDPIGTQYKIQDYAEALGALAYVPDWLTLTTSVVLCGLEFALGVFLLFGIMRKLVSRVMMLFMIVMTLITVWLYIGNPVSDCGCFGDAVHLTNGQTLLKNIILTVLVAVVCWRPMLMKKILSESSQWLVFHYSIIFILGMSFWSLYNIPVFDFRPYHIGANIPKGMEIPEGEKGPEFETTFILEKDGVRKEFTLDNYPDSTWTFIDSKSVQTTEGYVPPIHDFSITEIESGEDITDQVLSDHGYTFLLIAPHLEQADDSNFGNIDMIYEYAADHGYKFYCLTASGEKAIAKWKDYTGAEYPFCLTDETTLKTIIRSNPGLLLLKNGTVVGKWSHNFLPVDRLNDKPIEKTDIAKPEEGVSQKLMLIFLWYVLPLALLTLADRLWMWSRWFKKKEYSNSIFNLIKNKTNEKENRSRQLEDEQEPAGGRSSR